MTPPPTPHDPPAGPPIDLRLVGLNHLTASTAVREAITYSERAAGHWIRLAVERDAIDLGGPRVLEAALLCTCNRTEAYIVISTPPASTPEDELQARLARLLAGPQYAEIARQPDLLYQRHGREAVRHLLRVASGIDSMIQGEQQILGQVHQAHERAREAGGVGPVLDRLFTTAFHAGKRARSETAIGRGTVSVAGAAVELGIKVAGPLARHRVAVLGAGETGRLVAQHLAGERPLELVVVNRGLERAEALARETGGTALSLEGLPDLLQRVDLLVVAAGAPQPIVTPALVKAAQRHRSRSLVLVDISVPRNVDPAIDRLDGVYLFDLDALDEIVRDNLRRREDEVPKVEQLVDQELDRFCAWFRSLAAGPLISALRARFERIRHEEVQRHARHLNDREREAVERATRGLLNKLLHGPTVHLRNGGARDLEGLETIRRMFQLESGAEAEDPPDETAERPGSAAKGGDS